MLQALVMFALFAGLTTCRAAALRIVGVAEMALVNSITGSDKIVETASLVITVDGPRFRIRCGSVGREESTFNELGSDGVDVFLISNRRTPFNRDGNGVTGFVSPGRFPVGCSPIIQTAWLAYCSDGFFDQPANSVGLPLSYLLLPITPEDYVTNILGEAGGPFPTRIMGWSRRWIQANRGADPVEYTWYDTSGFKVWELVATNALYIGAFSVPSDISLVAFVPEARDRTYVHSGEDVIPLRRVMLTAEKIEEAQGLFEPLPQSRLKNVTIIDDRFKDLTGDFLLTANLSSNNWPVRDTYAYELMLEKAKEIALQNPAYSESRGPERKLILVAAVAINLVVCGIIFRKHLKT